jgi:hypothetical protein
MSSPVSSIILFEFLEGPGLSVSEELQRVIQSCAKNKFPDLNFYQSLRETKVVQQFSTIEINNLRDTFFDTKPAHFFD